MAIKYISPSLISKIQKMSDSEVDRGLVKKIYESQKKDLTKNESYYWKLLFYNIMQGYFIFIKLTPKN